MKAIILKNIESGYLEKPSNKKRLFECDRICHSDRVL